MSSESLNRPIEERGWVGFDLDGTLAEYHGWPKDGGIGEPIRPMLDIAKSMVDRMLHHGDMGVRIFTARVCPVGRPAQNDCEEQRRKIEAWCEEHIGMRLPVCHEKDFRMVALYDDRAEGVEQNTGKIISRELSAATERAEKAERERDEAREQLCAAREALRKIADERPDEKPTWEAACAEDSPENGASAGYDVCAWKLANLADAAIATPAQPCPHQLEAHKRLEDLHRAMCVAAVQAEERGEPFAWGVAATMVAQAADAVKDAVNSKRAKE